MKLWLYPVINRLRRGAARSRAKKNPTGERMTVRRGRLPDTEVLFYRPTAAADGPLPTLFLLHGGSWVLGSAPGCDLQARLISNLFGAAVVSVDYQMLYERPFPYQQTETADTVEYFLKNAEAYGLDPERFALLGFSAGGHIAAGTDMLLRGRGIKLYKVMLCYPFLDFVGFTLSDYAKAKGKTKRIIDKGAEELFFKEMKPENPIVSPAHAEPAVLKNLSPTVLLACGNGDDLIAHAKTYAENLKKAGNDVTYTEIPDAMHGFMEVNFPDHRPSPAHNEKQEALMHEAYAWLKDAFYA